MKNIFICIFLVLNILGADCCSQTENCDILPKPNTAYIIADSNSTTIAVHLENNTTEFNNVSLKLPIEHGLIVANLKQVQTKNGWISIKLPIVLHCNFKAPKISISNSKEIPVSDEKKLIVINLETERIAIVFGNSTESLKKNLIILKEILR